jgi:hypothetical protein
MDPFQPVVRVKQRLPVLLQLPGQPEHDERGADPVFVAHQRVNHVAQGFLVTEQVMDGLVRIG